MKALDDLLSTAPTHMPMALTVCELVRARYGDKDVMCGLLWTAGPEIMWLDGNKLDDALTKIGSLPTYDEDIDSLSL